MFQLRVKRFVFILEGRSVGIVRSRTKATELVYFEVWNGFLVKDGLWVDRYETYAGKM
jgi:hypothetical protein